MVWGVFVGEEKEKSGNNISPNGIGHKRLW